MKTKREKLIEKIGGQEVLDERAEHILDQEVYCQVDSMVEFIQEKEVYIDWEYTPEKEDGEDEGYSPEIFQYWIISEWLYNRMKEHNIAPVAFVEEIQLHLWGRTCCGQALLQDGTLQDVILAMEENR